MQYFVIRNTVFIHPDCDFMVWQKPSKETCPQCGSLLLEKGNKLLCMNEQCGYVK